MAASQSNGAPDFSLYLRAFETTGRMPHEDSGQLLQPGFDPRDDVDRLTDVETELAEAVERHIPLIALGRPGEQVGAGRALSTEKRWKEDIAQLGKAAVCIFMFPSARPGTLWEFDWLREHGFLNKTIFVVPPRKSRLTILPRDRESYDWETIWSDLTNIMKGKEIEFPDYDSRGQLFTIGSDGRVSTRTLLKGNYTALALKTFMGDHLTAIARLRGATLS